MSNDEARASSADADEFILLILSSPSGAGKSTLCARLRGRFPHLRFSVSHTTRRPRANEADGREYHFVDRATFETLIQRDGFVEWAEVHGNLYGTSLASIEEARLRHEGVLFDVDYQGARQIRAHFPDAVSVFVLPPSLQELERRLRNRASEDEASIKTRLAAALREIEHYGFFDYIVVNDELEAASEQLCGIVLAERCRRKHRARSAESLLRRAQQRR
ncbi:MAG: guanylate kinase [Polyangiaceae bacterium]|jgi:guanylate kinase|nr:guanylate kinase [Polyangiaceae bacterium]